jgi:hypothetical protein
MTFVRDIKMLFMGFFSLGYHVLRVKCRQPDSLLIPKPSFNGWEVGFAVERLPCPNSTSPSRSIQSPIDREKR